EPALAEPAQHAIELATVARIERAQRVGEAEQAAEREVEIGEARVGACWHARLDVREERRVVEIEPGVRGAARREKIYGRIDDNRGGRMHIGSPRAAARALRSPR